MTLITIAVDNFDNEIPAVERVVFVADGFAYVIDLGEDNLVAMKEAFAHYTSVAERVGAAVVTVNGETLGRGRKIRDTAPNGNPITRTPKTQLGPIGPPDKQPELDLHGPDDAATQPDDELPPHKSWLYWREDEAIGPGGKERQRRGRAYRLVMREWLRQNLYPDLPNRGIVPHDGIDAYWEHVQRTREQQSDTS